MFYNVCFLQIIMVMLVAHCIRFNFTIVVSRVFFIHESVNVCNCSPTDLLVVKNRHLLRRYTNFQNETLIVTYTEYMLTPLENVTPRYCTADV